MLLAGAALPGDAGPEGQVSWAVHVTVVPAWFDPGEAPIGTALMVLYALHDARAGTEVLPGRGHRQPCGDGQRPGLGPGF